MVRNGIVEIKGLAIKNCQAFSKLKISERNQGPNARHYSST